MILPKENKKFLYEVNTNHEKSTKTTFTFTLIVYVLHGDDSLKYYLHIVKKQGGFLLCQIQKN